MLKKGLNLFGTLLLALLCSCDQLTATTYMVGLVTSTPDASDIQGLPSELGSIVPLDSGTSSWATLFKRQSLLDSQPPTAITGAEVELTWNTERATLEETSNMAEGMYVATSYALPGGNSTPGLTYESGVDYKFVGQTATATYSVTVEAPDVIEASEISYSPALTEDGFLMSLDTHDGDDLTISWTGAVARAIVTMFKVAYNGGDDATDLIEPNNWQPQEQPVYSEPDFSAGPAAMLDFISSKADNSVTVPESAFSGAGLYCVLIQTVKLGAETAASSNVALGSLAAAGSGNIACFYVE
jgi:hypothetical protein